MSQTAIRRALYGRLAGDVTLNGLLGTPAPGYSKAIYHDEAPQAAMFPFVIFSKSSATPTEAMGVPSVFETDVWMIKGVDRSRSADTAEAIADRVATLLNDAVLSVAGGTVLYLRRQSDVDYPENTDGVSYRHCGALFRLVTEF